MNKLIHFNVEKVNDGYIAKLYASTGKYFEPSTWQKVSVFLSKEELQEIQRLVSLHLSQDIQKPAVFAYEESQTV